MMKMNRLVSLALIMLVAIIPIGCQAPATETEPVEIEFWTDWAPEGVQGTVLQTLLDEFNASQDGIVVTNVFMGGQRDERIAAALASEDPPDVAWISSSGGSYYEEGLLLPMDQVYGQAVDRDDIVDGLIDEAAYLGVDTVIPFENSNLAVLYNKDMLDEKGVEYPPAEVGAWTWSDFVEMAQLFSDPDAGEFGYDPSWSTAMLHIMIWEGGSEVFSEDLKTNLVCSDPDTRAITIKSLERFHDFVWESRITTNDVGDMGFGSQDMAFTITGPWAMPRFAETSPDLNIGVASMPADEDTGLSISYWYMKNLAVFRTDEERQNATLEFLEWFYSPEIQARWCAEAGYLPITKSAMEHEIWQDFAAENPYVEVFLDQGPLMKRRPDGLPRGEIGTMMDAARFAEAAPEEAVDTYCETAQQVLDEFWAHPDR